MSARKIHIIKKQMLNVGLIVHVAESEFYSIFIYIFPTMQTPTPQSPANYANNRLKIANHNVAPKYVSVWSSGLTSSVCLPHTNWAVQVWGASSWQENFDLISNGFNVVLSHVNAWYLDCGFGSWRTTGNTFCIITYLL